MFVYQERIKPESIAPELQPSVDVYHSALSGGREFVGVKVRMTHSGGAPLAVAGMVVNVYGIRYGNAAAERAEHPMNGVTEISYSLPPSRPVLLYTFLDTWHGFGAKKAFGSLAGNGQSFAETLSFVTQQNRYDVAKIEWQICWSRPGNRQWPITAQRQADGSFWFPGVNGAPSHARFPDLYCAFQGLGAFFPL